MKRGQQFRIDWKRSDFAVTVEQSQPRNKRLADFALLIVDGSILTGTEPGNVMLAALGRNRRVQARSDANLLQIEAILLLFAILSEEPVAHQ